MGLVRVLAGCRCDSTIFSFSCPIFCGDLKKHLIEKHPISTTENNFMENKFTTKIFFVEGSRAIIIDPVHEISNNVVCATSKASDQPAHTRSLIRAFASYSMIVKLLTEHHLEFLSLKGGCRGLSESTLVKMSNCWNLMPRLNYGMASLKLFKYGKKDANYCK